MSQKQWRTEKKVDRSTVITYSLLRKLCDMYWNVIGTGIKDDCPKIRIRYVEDKGKFGYAWFGDFFFFSDDLFVWKKGEAYAAEHNQDVVDGVFGEEFVGNGYACRFLFAGVDTNRVDCNGEHIFTGDILEIADDTCCRAQLALSAFPDTEENWARYCFVLDNHSLLLDDCLRDDHKKVTRIGTAFFQLDWNFESTDMNERVRSFNGWHDTNKVHESKVFMARYTPNFDKEEWKYRALEILGVEYDWR